LPVDRRILRQNEVERSKAERAGRAYRADPGRNVGALSIPLFGQDETVQR
jgi:hypothetical protein